MYYEAVCWFSVWIKLHLYVTHHVQQHFWGEWLASCIKRGTRLFGGLAHFLEEDLGGLGSKFLRHFPQLRVEFLANKIRHVSYLDFKLCANFGGPFLNCPAAILFVSHLAAFMLDEPLDL